ncbi:MAG: HAD family hydrolase [Nanoarchaeota archaeon]|nr:HAD family hydrolase [Nanoarchaeota archaeon]
MGVIFDLDGTILDSTEVHAKYVWLALQKLPEGKKITYEYVRENVRSPFIMFCNNAEKRYGIKINDEIRRKILNEKDRLFRKNQAKGIHLFPGALRIIRFLQRKGVKVCIVSSINDAELRVIKKKIDLNKVGIKIINAKKPWQEKPNPYTLKLAMKRLKMLPKRTVYIGDSEYDSIASKRAGINFIGVYNKRLKNSTLFFNDLNSAGEYLYKSYKKFLDKNV